MTANIDCQAAEPVDWADVVREVKVGASLGLRNTFTYDDTAAPFDMSVNVIECALKSSSQVLGTQVVYLKP